jgi:hypothetical protein
VHWHVVNVCASASMSIIHTLSGKIELQLHSTHGINNDVINTQYLFSDYMRIMV